MEAAAEEDISCSAEYNQRLSLTLMTTKLKYTETRSMACFYAAATYLILLLSCGKSVTRTVAD